MARKDPSLLPAVPSITDTKEFTDTRTGEVYEFTFQVQDGNPEELYLLEQSKRYRDIYLTGGKTLKVRGVSIRFSESLILNIVFLMMIDQTQDEDGPPWPFEKWASFSVQCREAWNDVLAWAMELRGKARGENWNEETSDLGDALKNDSAAGVASG